MNRWASLLDPDPLAAMIAAEHLLADTDDFDDWADQAEAITADEITQRRLAKCVRRHPAGSQR